MTLVSFANLWVLSVAVMLWYQVAYHGLGLSLPQGRFYRVVRVLLRPLRVALVWHPLPLRSERRREALLLEAHRNPARAAALLKDSDPTQILYACMTWRDLQLPAPVQAALMAQLTSSREVALRFLRTYVTDRSVLMEFLASSIVAEARSDVLPSIDHDVLWAVANCPALDTEVLLRSPTALARDLGTYSTSDLHGTDPLEGLFAQEDRNTALEMLRLIAYLFPDDTLREALVRIESCAPLHAPGCATLLQPALEDVSFLAVTDDAAVLELFQRTDALRECEDWIPMAAALKRSGARGTARELLDAAVAIGR